MRLRTQLSMLAGLVIAALVAVQLLVVIPGWQAELERSAVERGRAVVAMLAHSAAEAAMVGNYSELQRRLDDLAASEDVTYAAILDRQGRVTVSSSVLDERPFFPLDKKPPDPARILVDSAVEVRWAKADIYDKRVLDFAAPLTVYRRSWGMARLGLSVAPLEEATSAVRLKLLGLGLASLFVAVLLIGLLAATVTRPLSRLAATAKRIAGGELAARASPSGAKEVRQLGGAFNGMAEAVEDQVAEIHRKTSELEAGYRVLARLGTTIDREALMQGVLEVIAEVLSAERCELLALDPRQGVLDRFTFSADGFATGNLTPAAFSVERFTEVRDLAELLRGHLAPAEGDLFVPLAIDDQTMGVLTVHPAEDAAFSADDDRLARGITTHLLVALENARLYELAITDGLTGLTIRRYFSARLREELDRARRYVQPFSLLMIDIDHFKRVNDSHGHPAGDMVLRGLAHRLKEALRSTDLLSRWGGEELTVLLPGQSPEQGRTVAEKLRQEVAARPFSISDGQTIQVTISIGVAAFPDHGPDADELVAAADKTLYAAKQAGRNQVMLAAARVVQEVIDDEEEDEPVATGEPPPSEPPVPPEPEEEPEAEESEKQEPEEEVPEEEEPKEEVPEKQEPEEEEEPDDQPDGDKEPADK